MRNPGLEPGSLAALEPESSASAIPPVPLAHCLYRQFYDCGVKIYLCQVKIEKLVKNLRFFTSFSAD